MKRLGAIVVVVGLILAATVFLWQRKEAPSTSPASTNVAKAVETDVDDTTNSPSRQRIALLRPTYSGAGTNTAAAPSTNLLSRLLKGDGDLPHIRREQAEAYATANGRRADSLLAAWRASGDAAFLREAMEEFPNDPQVAYMAWSRNGLADSPDDYAKAKAEWLEKFKQAAPDNAIPSYLSARALLKSGDLDGALKELSAAQGKSWRDYTLDSIQATEEAYRSSGYSEAEAKAIASMGALLPHVTELRSLGKSLNELSATQRSSGNNASAEAAAEWALQLGQRTGQEGTMTLIQQLVAVAIQKDTLKALDPNATIGGSDLTAQQRLAALDQQRETIRAVARESSDVMPRLSEADLSNYFDRLKLFGEAAAVNWAKARMAASATAQ